ncbi:tetratricopeptide repeat protein [Acinetobacter sp. YH12145]|uniref:tetratricopeptide repeat protein n=1 Tax=Acinetobacter sp. YH12145 TaxID=2601129 RepID=UPI0015D42275|nr:SEL1-like repeat protein [Acinetobacter sp. YH12145]
MMYKKIIMSSIVAICTLGSSLSIAKDYFTSEQTEALAKSAEIGSAEAQHIIGLNFYYGLHGYEIDYFKAKELFLKAADQKHAKAYNMLGLIYANGNGVPANPEFSTLMYRKSAELGDISGMLILGSAYRNGFGVEKNLSKAFELINSAAQHKNESAIKILAYMYYHGEGVIVDKNKAYELHELAKKINENKN